MFSFNIWLLGCYGNSLSGQHFVTLLDLNSNEFQLVNEQSVLSSFTDFDLSNNLLP